MVARVSRNLVYVGALPLAQSGTGWRGLGCAFNRSSVCEKPCESLNLLWLAGCNVLDFERIGLPVVQFPVFGETSISL